jgi:hypothetical protein
MPLRTVQETTIPQATRMVRLLLTLMELLVIVVRKTFLATAVAMPLRTVQETTIPQVMRMVRLLLTLMELLVVVIRQTFLATVAELAMMRVLAVKTVVGVFISIVKGFAVEMDN